MALTRTCLVTLVVAMLAPAAGAHHNAAPLYDQSRSITIEGTVKEFRFINPHARVYLVVVHANGKAEEWLAEGANAGVLRRLGWAGDELKPGDRIIVTGAPARDGSPKVEWRTLTRADGTQLGGGNGLPRERNIESRNGQSARRAGDRRTDDIRVGRAECGAEAADV